MPGTYDARAQWSRVLAQEGMAYPAEYVIRLFRGTYPRLDLSQEDFTGRTICDIGFGDGRHLAFLHQCGFEVAGVEITDSIVEQARHKLAGAGINHDWLRVGRNDRIPFDDATFDYLLSWNACYYMGEIEAFGTYVREFARVTRPGGRLVMSIPKQTCFIYRDSEPLRDVYRVIRNDPFNCRNGEVLRVFRDTDEIEAAFSPLFHDFTFGSIEDDCFGYDYHWHLIVCRRSE